MEGDEERLEPGDYADDDDEEGEEEEEEEEEREEDDEEEDEVSIFGGCDARDCVNFAEPKAGSLGTTKYLTKRPPTHSNAPNEQHEATELSSRSSKRVPALFSREDDGGSLRRRVPLEGGLLSVDFKVSDSGVSRRGRNISRSDQKQVGDRDPDSCGYHVSKSLAGFVSFRTSGLESTVSPTEPLQSYKDIAAQCWQKFGDRSECIEGSSRGSARVSWIGGSTGGPAGE